MSGNREGSLELLDGSRMPAASVLVVDDNALNVDVIRNLLADQPLEMIAAASCAAALEAIGQQVPDMILLDIAMPGTDGIETCRQIRARDDCAQLPIIFVTAMGNRLEEAFEAGGDDFITKPVQREELICRMRVHLRASGMLREIQAHAEHLQREREVARHVMDGVMQNNVYPHGVFRMFQRPQNEFSGDLVMTALHPQQGLYVLAADFTGHGLPAAIGTVPLSLTFRTMTEKGLSVGDLAYELNRVLLESCAEGMYSAAVVINLNAQGDRVSIWQGGLPDGYLKKPEGGLRNLCSLHMALAMEESHEFDRAVHELEVTPGTRLYFLSDGLGETFNAAGEMFGEERLEHVLRTADEPIDDLPVAVDAWRGDAPQDDDLTIIELTCAVPGENPA